MWNLIKCDPIIDFNYYLKLLFILYQVAIKKEDLHKYHSDNWFPLTPIDHDSEVQVKIGFTV